jgi:hypothetical protein
MQHSLASFASDTSVLFRFLLASNGSNVSEGFGFDDIIVAESNDLKLVSLIYSDTICGNSATTIRGLVCNNSVIDQNGFTVDIDTNGNVVSATISDTLQVCGCDTFDLFTFNSSDGGTWNFTAELNNSGDVNAANDTASGVIFAYPSPKVYASGGGTKCEGETDTLTFTFVGTSPWNLSYTDGTSTQYNGNVTNPFTVVVTQSGNYQATGLSDASGCPADTSNMFGIASYTFVPSPQIDLGNDTTVCGDYILDAGSGYSAYDWSTGATGQSITASNSGNYSVTVLSSLGCEGSGSINLTILDVPIIDIHDDVICEGTTYLFNAGGGSASYVWHDGSTGQVYQVSGVGQVSVTVTGFNGCVSTATAFITAVVSNPTPTVTSTASIAPVTLNAGSGYIDYNWNTGDTSQTITVYAVGTYTCTVTDDNGCIGSDDVKTKIWPSSVEELTVDRGFSVFPNPADDWVTIQFTESQVPAFAEIIDLKGVLVKKAPLAQHGRAQLLNVSKLPVGVYIIRCSIDDSISQQTFNVTR